MDGFTDLTSISKKIFYFFSKSIDLDAIVQKIISIILTPIKLSIKFIKKLIIRPINFITINIGKFKIKSQNKLKNVLKSHKNKVHS